MLTALYPFSANSRSPSESTRCRVGVFSIMPSLAQARAYYRLMTISLSRGDFRKVHSARVRDGSSAISFTTRQKRNSKEIVKCKTITWTTYKHSCVLRRVLDRTYVVLMCMGFHIINRVIKSKVNIFLVE
jgi:hypothetical protein